MKGKYLRKLGAFVLTALIFPGLVTLLSGSSSGSSTHAQGRIVVVRRPVYRPFFRPWGWRRSFGYDPYFDYYSRYGHYVFSSSESAFNAGYRDGIKTGEGDATHRRTYSPERSHYFQEAGFGNFGEVYRQGFVKGYADGYRS